MNVLSAIHVSHNVILVDTSLIAEASERDLSREPKLCDRGCGALQNLCGRFVAQVFLHCASGRAGFSGLVSHTNTELLGMGRKREISSHSSSVAALPMMFSSREP